MGDHTVTAVPASGCYAQVDCAHVAAIGPSAAILFARISWRAQETGEWRATRAELMRETGLTENMIRSAVDVLRNEGWVTSRRTSREDATLIWAPVSAGPPDRGSSTRGSGENHADPPAEPTISSTETGKTDTPTPAGDGLFDTTPQLRSVPSTAELDAEFDRFWSLYPRRTGKRAARTAYGRARQRASVQAIASGLRAQLPGMLQREVQYVPHPTTWLNQDRWEDDVQPLRPPGQPSPAEVFTTQNAASPADYVRTLPPPRTDPFASGAL